MNNTLLTTEYRGYTISCGFEGWTVNHGNGATTLTTELNAENFIDELLTR